MIRYINSILSEVYSRGSEIVLSRYKKSWKMSITVVVITCLIQALSFNLLSPPLFLDITEAPSAAKEPTMMKETRKKRQARSVLPRGKRIQPVMARIRERVMRMTM